MVGTLSFGVCFRAIRHAIKPVESADEDIGIGSTKPFAAKSHATFLKEYQP
jgi:hypothetical protein